VIVIVVILIVLSVAQYARYKQLRNALDRQDTFNSYLIEYIRGESEFKESTLRFMRITNDSLIEAHKRIDSGGVIFINGAVDE
jgi:hypothetical protein